jgi:hypothetical protein
MPKPASRKPRSRVRRAAVQYTVRDVPVQVDRLLRQKAAQEGRSLNQVLRDALVREAGGEAGTVIHDDLDHLAGRWEEDPEVDRALAEQDRVDESLWK